MRVFVTGATGYVGSAVVRTLVAGGHQVTGLVRSADKAAVLEALGGRPVRGDLRDPASFRGSAAEHDCCVHLGFDYGPDGVATDRAAIVALIETSRGRNSPGAVVYTSGVLCLGNTGHAAEDAAANPIPIVAWRPAHEELTLDAATGALATAVIRPGFVYGGDKGLIAGYFDSATRDGAAAYVGSGANRFALIHRDDLAALYRLVVEHRARGMFHGVDGAAPRIAELARVASLAAGKGGTTRSIPVDHARQMMGPYADALCTDQVVVTTRAVELGWKPSHRSPLDAMDECLAEWRGANQTSR